MRRRSIDRTTAAATRRPLSIQELEPRLALAVATPPAPAVADVTGPSVTAFTQPLVSGRTVTVTGTFNEPVTIRGSAGVPCVVGRQTQNLVAKASWPSRVVAFTGTLPTAAGSAPPAVTVTQRIVTGVGTRIVDRTGNAAVSLARPARVTLSGLSVAENQPAGAVVGSLGTVDPDGGRDTFRYSLVTGPGSADNGSFRIVGGRLVTAAPLDFETRSVLSVRIRATDAGGLWAETVFRIRVTDVPEARLTGRVVDGLSGAVGNARVFADADGDRVLDWTDGNGDGTWDPGEGEVWTTTGSDGLFTGRFDSPTTPLVVAGGLDPNTGHPFDPDRGFLAAPAGSTVVGPLSTLVEAAVREAPAGGLAAARRLVATGLGLPAGIDLTTYDPVARNDIAVGRRAVVVANVLVAAVRRGGDQEAVLRRFVAALAAASGPLDLADPAVVAGIVGDSAAGGDVRTRFLAGDNRQALAAETFPALFDIARTAQADQAVVVDGAAASTVVYRYDWRRNPLGLANWVASLAGEDAARFSTNGFDAVSLRAPADLAAKPVYRFAMVLIQKPGPWGFRAGAIPVTVRVVPADS